MELLWIPFWLLMARLFYIEVLAIRELTRRYEFNKQLLEKVETHEDLENLRLLNLNFSVFKPLFDFKAWTRETLFPPEWYKPL